MQLEVFPDPRPAVDWADVEGVAQLAFSIWVDQPELAWAKRAWQILTGAKLTVYGNELEHYQVFFRMLVLGGIYSDFCDAAWEEYSEPSYSDWAEPLKLDGFVLGQLYAKLPEWDPENEETAEEALDTLVENERDAVVAALMAAFGGVSGLYASLWESRKAEARESDEDPEPDDDDTYDPENSQMAAYSWVDQGCGRYR